MASRLCSSLSFGAFFRPGTLNKVETVFLTSVRWRKPRWAPLAPTKLLKVRERPSQDPVEYEELKLRYTHYRSTVRSLRSYFKSELIAKTEALTGQSFVQQEEQHLAYCIDENKKWNEESAKLRHTREVEFEKEKHELDLQQMIRMEEEQKELQKQLRSEVLKAKEESKTFASSDNLESMIEVALNQRSNYNFAIDLSGNRYVEQSDGSTIIQNKEENVSNVTSSLANENADTKSITDENKLE